MYSALYLYYYHEYLISINGYVAAKPWWFSEDCWTLQHDKRLRKFLTSSRLVKTDSSMFLGI
jgi:hypothetical protein